MENREIQVSTGTILAMQGRLSSRERQSDWQNVQALKRNMKHQQEGRNGEYFLEYVYFNAIIIVLD